jgi:Arc/MetJ-type ribon-helix-helix transcriptional regulator
MTEQKKTQVPDGGSSRSERLRAALRENLKRRKSQARSRAAPSRRPKSVAD